MIVITNVNIKPIAVETAPLSWYIFCILITHGTVTGKVTLILFLLEEIATVALIILYLSHLNDSPVASSPDSEYSPITLLEFKYFRLYVFPAVLLSN
jgi:hypothetical protein